MICVPYKVKDNASIGEKSRVKMNIKKEADLEL